MIAITCRKCGKQLQADIWDARRQGWRAFTPRAFASYRLSAPTKLYSDGDEGRRGGYNGSTGDTALWIATMNRGACSAAIDVE